MNVFAHDCSIRKRLRKFQYFVFVFTGDLCWGCVKIASQWLATLEVPHWTWVKNIYEPQASRNAAFFNPTNWLHRMSTIRARLFTASWGEDPVASGLLSSYHGPSIWAHHTSPFWKQVSVKPPVKLPRNDFRVASLSSLTIIDPNFTVFIMDDSNGNAKVTLADALLPSFQCDVAQGVFGNMPR
jgi:hypothetical protein